MAISLDKPEALTKRYGNQLADKAWSDLFTALHAQRCKDVVATAYSLVQQADTARPNGEWPLVYPDKGPEFALLPLEGQSKAIVAHLMNYYPWPVLRLDDTVLYVLYHRPSGVVMPDFKGRAGGTYIDPLRPEPGSKPRLFTSKKSAGDALRWWAEGKVKVGFDGGDYGEAPYTFVDGMEPVEGRNAKDWWVVPVSLDPKWIDVDA